MSDSRPSTERFRTSSTTPTSTRRRARTPTSATSIPTSATWRSASIARSDGHPGDVVQRAAGALHVQELPGGRVRTSSSPRWGSRTPASDDEGGMVIPGSLLTRLNPLKELDAEGRKEFAQPYRDAAGAARQPRRPPHGHGRAGHPVRGQLRGAARHRGRVRGRLRRALRQPRRAQPLPRHGVGLQLRGPAVHAAVHLVRRSRAARASCSTRS